MSDKKGKEKKPEEKKEVVKKKFPYEVAEGKSITSKKGILGPGAEVKAEYFAGEKTLEVLVDKKMVVKN